MNLSSDFSHPLTQLEDLLSEGTGFCLPCSHCVSTSRTESGKHEGISEHLWNEWWIDGTNECPGNGRPAGILSSWEASRFLWPSAQGIHCLWAEQQMELLDCCLSIWLVMSDGLNWDLFHPHGAGLSCGVLCKTEEGPQASVCPQRSLSNVLVSGSLQSLKSYWGCEGASFILVISGDSYHTRNEHWEI